VTAATERRRENNDDTKAVPRSRIDRLCRRRDMPLREKTLWRMLYESASRVSAVLALNIEDLDLPNRQARIVTKGGHIIWITWGTDTARLLPRLIAGRTSGPLFLSEYRLGPHRRPTTDPKDICSETGGARLGYDRARILLALYADGLRLHQLRHSSATHLARTTPPPTSSWPRPGIRACGQCSATSNPASPPSTRPPRHWPAPADAADQQLLRAAARFWRIPVPPHPQDPVLPRSGGIISQVSGHSRIHRWPSLSLLRET
jgi:integrase